MVEEYPGVFVCQEKGGTTYCGKVKLDGADRGREKPGA